jgi:hypothetical protein
VIAFPVSAHGGNVPIYLPKQGQSTELPITILDKNSLTQNDEEMLVAMSEHPPKTDFRPGDLGYLVEAVPYLKNTSKMIPRIWQVRFIISQWQHELMRLVHSEPVAGIDHAAALLESRGFAPANYRKPILYCHAFPHGLYPDSAAWMPVRALRRLTFRENNQQWESILDEAKAPYIGYDPTNLIAPYIYDLAPSMYADGENLGHPFSFEEATVHTAALLGMEEVMFKPVDAYYISSPYAIDPMHDIFKRNP